MYKRMIEYIATVRTQYSILEGPIKAFGAKLLMDILAYIDVLSEDTGYVISNLQKAQAKMQKQIFDFNLVQYAKLYCQAGVFKKSEQKELVSLIVNLEEKKIKEILIENLPQFEKKLKKVAKEEVGSDYIINGIKDSLIRLNEQLSLFGDDE